MALSDFILCLIILLAGICLIVTEGRPKTKTIKTKFGDVYDCKDFYEQLTLKHLQTQNHEYHPEMRPSFIPKRTTISNILTSNFEYATTQMYRLEDGGCPSGTVPIRRGSKEDYARASESSQNQVHSKLSSNPSRLRHGTRLAVLQTKSSPNPPTYYGVGANISLWNPQVKENQYSAGQITISNGADSLQAGWIVHPTMNKSNLTRMFIHTTIGESDCYNTYCSGFVQVHKELPVDMIIDWPPHHPGWPQPMFNFVIYRDPPTGHWWFLVTHDYKPIGFWPNNIFSDMSKFGTYVSCGGETYSPPNHPGDLPPMGNGAFPIGNLDLDSYATDFAIVNYKNVLEDVQDLERFMNSKKYNVRDIEPDYSNWGRTLCFGGYGD